MSSIIKKTSLIIDDLLSAMKNAQSEILFQTFYFDNDEIGKNIIQTLSERASHGVKVTCLFDALGAHGLSGSKDEKDATSSGVRIEYFNWLTPWSVKNKRSWFFRNHKRSLIIDGQILHIGGWCIGRRTSDWLDANLSTTNVHVIHRAITDFRNMYHFARRKTTSFHHEQKFSYSLDPLHTHQYAYQAPLLRARHIYYTYLKLINNATKEIVLIAPYFVPGRRLMRAILKAKRRGVDVHICIPQNTDYRTVDIAARTFFTKLLRYNIRIYLHPEMLHAKISIIDDVVFVGSLNLDNVSLRYNFENGVFVRDGELLLKVHEDIEILKKSSRQVEYKEWMNRSWFDKFLEKIVNLFKGFL